MTTRDPAVMSDAIKKRECGRCGKMIFLVPAGLHFKWITNPRKLDTWHCGSDLAFPVRSHSPRTVAPCDADPPLVE